MTGAAAERLHSALLGLMLATMMQAAAALRIQATVRGHLARTAALQAAAEESQLLRTALQVRPSADAVTHSLSSMSQSCPWLSLCTRSCCSDTELTSHWPLMTPFAMQPLQPTDVGKEERLGAMRERKRGLLQRELATTRKAVRRRLKEVDGPRMRSDIQHKVPPDWFSVNITIEGDPNRRLIDCGHDGSCY